MKKTMCIVFIVLIASCTSYKGNQDILNPGIISQIETGKTTKEEVITLIGNPTTEFISSEITLMTYSFTVSHRKLSSVNTGIHQVTITVDETGIVKDVSSYQSGKDIINNFKMKQND